MKGGFLHGICWQPLHGGRVSSHTRGKLGGFAILVPDEFSTSHGTAGRNSGPGKEKKADDGCFERFSKSEREQCKNAMLVGSDAKLGRAGH